MEFCCVMVDFVDTWRLVYSRVSLDSCQLECCLIDAAVLYLIVNKMTNVHCVQK